MDDCDSFKYECKTIKTDRNESIYAITMTPKEEDRVLVLDPSNSIPKMYGASCSYEKFRKTNFKQLNCPYYYDLELEMVFFFTKNDSLMFKLMV